MVGLNDVREMELMRERPRERAEGIVVIKHLKFVGPTCHVRKSDVAGYI